jgi:anhydro-N-acetylmuramic acid kinase
MLVLGLMSGTSVDGIDAALVKITDLESEPEFRDADLGQKTDRKLLNVKPLRVELIAGQTYKYDLDLQTQILGVCGGKPLTMEEYCDLDDRIAIAFAQAAQSLQQNLDPSLAKADIKLIGSHGQTVFHRPPHHDQSDSRLNLGYSLQLGRGAVIAQRTGITTINNFRAADIALGGQGAPLVPMVDALLLSHPHQPRICQNIGGIANLTYLPATDLPFTDLLVTADGDTTKSGNPIGSGVFGFDNGPGNVLLDMAAQKLFGVFYDADGHLARQGTAHQGLLQKWLAHPYFQQSPPKSTGRELFSPDYLEQCLIDCEAIANFSAYDIMATLTEFTATAIADSYQRFLPTMPAEVLLCGGGARNSFLKERIQHHLHQWGPISLQTTDSVGISSDSKEAIAFAVLAYLRWHEREGNLPNVTGASRSTLLGEIHYP